MDVTLRGLSRVTGSLPGRVAATALLLAAAAGCSTLPTEPQQSPRAEAQGAVPASIPEDATTPAMSSDATSTPAAGATSVKVEPGPSPQPDAMAALITLDASAPRDSAGQDAAASPSASVDAAAPIRPEAPKADAAPTAAEAAELAREGGAPGVPDAPDMPSGPPTAPATEPVDQPSTAVATPVEGAEQIDLWERIRRGFAIPDLETKLAANRTQWYASQTDYMDRMAQRASLYLYHIVEEIEKRGMPTELALLPFVESAMQPEAVSSAKAAGLWQFIPSTGKIYALEQNHWQDQRRDIIESTRAALDYLEKLHGDFGDWHLALAAYNWGEGAVARAIARNKAQRKPASYTSLRMPRETQYYVPKLQAIENIVRDPARYGIQLPALRNEPYFVAVSKERDIDVETAARLAEMPVDEFRALNPGFNRPVIVGAAQPTLLLPAARADTFHANLAAFEATGQPLASWTTYTLAKNETLAQVAQRADISEAKLRDANRIPPRYRLAAGSTILVPRDDSTDDDIAPQHLDAAFTLVPDSPNLRQVTYKVRRGDTLNSVSRRFKVQTEEIIAWNHLRSPALFAGQRLTLTVARGPARPSSKSPPPASRAAKPAPTKTTPAASRPGQKGPSAAAAKPVALKPAAHRSASKALAQLPARIKATDARKATRPQATAQGSFAHASVQR